MHDLGSKSHHMENDICDTANRGVRNYTCYPPPHPRTANPVFVLQSVVYCDNLKVEVELCLEN